ncbi:MAG TPA: LPS assembly protein LptD [Steroidobacteraceae bacterium]|nr:LPS assembly protein LptD [Steroidobacteraceae bacterium]HRX87919.1 LPS assembly protein LptD [Steroidobacteraceae bacterium]
MRDIGLGRGFHAAMGVGLLLGAPWALAADPVCTPNTAIPPLQPLDTGSLDIGPTDSTASDRIIIASDVADVEASGDADLSGNVEVRQNDKRIRADQVTYDAATGEFRVIGSVQYEDSLVRATGGSGSYSQVLGAEFEGAEFELLERNARGSARAMRLEPGGRFEFDDVSFTGCPVDDEAWRIQASQIALDPRTRNGTGRNARIEFKGVPILYTPWISFPLGPQRKSGFLFPDVGVSSRNGVELTVPYYWNIAPNVDLTFAPAIYAKRGLDLGGEFRFLSARQRALLEFNYLPRDQLTDSDRGRVHLEQRYQLPSRWQFTADATHVSDNSYFEDFARGSENTSIPFTERFAEFSYRDLNWTLRAQAQHFQILDSELALIDRPYTRVPRLVANGEWTLGNVGGLAWGFDSELVNFERSTGVTGWRLDAAPRLGFDWSGPGYFLRPQAGYRYTSYSLNNTAAGVNDSPSRELPFVTLDSGVILERPSGSRGQRRLTLEPRALYLYTPYRAQDELPVFDTIVPDLNTVQLFRTTRYTGADRVSDANQLSIGVTSRLFDTASGAQFVSLTLGQAFYFERTRVSLPDETTPNRNKSDFVAQLRLTAYNDWSLDAALQFNPEDNRSERAQFSIQYRPGNDRVVNLAYRSQRNSIEQAEVSAAWPIGARWSAFARVIYSLRENESLDQFAGFEYRACCWRVRTVARRFVSSRTGEQDTGVFLQLELTGLASVGTPADAFLARSIRGYSPEKSAR